MMRVVLEAVVGPTEGGSNKEFEGQCSSSSLQT